MKLSEIANKELVDLNEGCFWGPVGRADLLIDELSGEINAMVLTGRGGFMGISQGEEIVIPWSSVIKAGKDVIILDIDPEKSFTEY